MRNKLILILAACQITVACSPGLDTAPVRAYIAQSWDATLRYHPVDTPDSLIGLPRPYTVPCAEGMFNELYYWDTFFTNEGLLLDGRVEVAKDNTEDILCLIDRYGFMPNGNRLWYLSRSQPPYACLMVEKVYEATADTTWLRKAFPLLEKEYGFWMRERMTPTGLNRYGWNDVTEELVEEFVTTAGKRLGCDFRRLGWDGEQLRKFALDCIAECESGWDFNPRFERRCSDFCPMDLNATLYGVETAMSRFAAVLGMDSQTWTERAERRKERMEEYFYDPEKKAYFDYDYVHGRRSEVVTAAAFSLLFNRALSAAQAERVRGMLSCLEYPAGLAVCADGDYGFPYQWSYPNAWPPTTWLAVQGLRNYGFDADARRLAEKSLSATVSLWNQSGKLWEKMRCTDASMPVDKEYETPEMMGWTAGVFILLDEYIKNTI